MAPHLIALEEHYYSATIFEGVDIRLKTAMATMPGLKEQLLAIGDDRLQSMDAGNVRMQVVSHAFTPKAPSAEACMAGNDELALAIAACQQPSRFSGFAILPVGDPAASATELERAVSCHGFLGALVNNHADGQHFDGPQYDVLWTKACALDVPIYLHPTWPAASKLQDFAGAYPMPVAMSLGGPGWGWHGDVGLHVLKLYCAGIFDRFPTLKLIIGHMGETLPFMLERCYDMSKGFAGGWGERKRDLPTVWRENIWVTTSGVWSLVPFRCLLANTAIDHIMYSVDYPFESNEKGREWFDELTKSGLLSAQELEQVAHRNASKLLKLADVSPDA